MCVLPPSRNPVKRYTGIVGCAIFLYLSNQKLCQFNADRLGHRFFVKLGADNAEPSYNTRSAKTNVRLAGDVIKVDPASVVGFDDTLCSEYHTEFFCVREAFKRCLELFGIELLRCLCAKAYEHLVGVMVVMTVVMMMPARAVTVFIVFVVVMLVLVVAAITVVVVMLVLMVATITVVVVMLVLVVATIIIVVVVLTLVVVMMRVSLFLKLGHFGFKGGSALHSLEKLLARKLIPGSRNYDRLGVMFLKECDAIAYLLLGYISRMTENYTARIFNLIVEKFAKVLHMHLALICVNYGSKAVKLRSLGVCVLYRLDNVGELTHARRLDKNTVWSVLGNNLLECLREVSDK